MNTSVISGPASPLEQQTDIVFMLDGSERVLPVVFKQQKDFVKALASNFNTSPKGPRASAIVYATNHSVVSSFDDPDFNQRVDASLLLGKPRRISSALEFAAQYLINYSTGDRKFVVLLTAGNQVFVSGTKSLKEAAKPLRDIDAEIFVVAIGEEPNTSQLNPIVDKPQNVLTVAIKEPIVSQARNISKASEF